MEKLGESTYKFPKISVYGESVGHILYTPNSPRKYDHNIYEDFKGNAYLYNENILPSLFYGKGVVIVEGIFDCFSVLQYGLPCIAATTNSLSFGHLEKIYRYTNRVVFWHDSDDHGESGFNRTRIKMDKVGTFICTPFSNNKAKDANDLLQENPEEFQRSIEYIKGILNET